MSAKPNNMDVAGFSVSPDIDNICEFNDDNFLYCYLKYIYDKIFENKLINNKRSKC